MKSYGAYVVVGDDYIRTREFRDLIGDLPKPKLALNCVGGETATEMARLLGYASFFVISSFLPLFFRCCNDVVVELLMLTCCLLLRNFLCYYGVSFLLVKVELW